MKETFLILNRMQADGIIGSYALGGAVGATFYLEPVATLDVDIFVVLAGPATSPLLSLGPVYEYLLPLGYRAEGEYIHIGDWPIQFLAPAGQLEEEAIDRARETDLEGIPIRVMTAEHLAAIALSVGRAKDFSRILQFIEAGALDVPAFNDILVRHQLLPKWETFGRRFLTSDPP